MQAEIHSWAALKKHEDSGVHPQEELLSNGPDQKSTGINTAAGC